MTSTSISKDKDSNSYRYRLLLADPVLDSNQAWWNKQFEVWQQNQNGLDNAFTGVTSGFSSSDNNSLNKKCEAVYSKADTKIKVVEKNEDIEQKFTSNSDTHLIRNFWKFCSLINTRPQNLSDTKESKSSNSYISNTSSEFGYVLASAKENVNNEFWKLKEEWYKTIKDNKTKEQEEFNKYVEGENQTLRKICFKASQAPTSTEDSIIEVILKRCSFMEYPFKETLDSYQEDLEDDEDDDEDTEG